MNLQTSEFSRVYELAKTALQSSGNFQTMSQGFSCKKNWPQGSGGYLIWRIISPEDRELLYIGKSGTLKRCANGNLCIRDEQRGFCKRLDRWTPYSFFPDSFCYAPKFSGNTKPKSHSIENYASKVPLKEIEVDFFICPKIDLAPAYIEAVLLQSYIATYNQLPPANNGF